MSSAVSAVVYVILYARVSREEQVKGYSLAQQLEALRDYAARNGYTVYEEIVDPGYSGASLVRPGMDRVRVMEKRGDHLVLGPAALAHDSRDSQKMSHVGDVRSLADLAAVQIDRVQQGLTEPLAIRHASHHSLLNRGYPPSSASPVL